MYSAVHCIFLYVKLNCEELGWNSTDDLFWEFSVSILLSVSAVNKHKPWIETSYHGVITENTDVVLLDPPLVALDKDAPIPYAGKMHSSLYDAGQRGNSDQMEAV